MSPCVLTQGLFYEMINLLKDWLALVFIYDILLSIEDSYLLNNFFTQLNSVIFKNL